MLFELADKDEVVSNIEIENNNIYGAIKLFKDTFNINQQVKITVDKKDSHWLWFRGFKCGYKSLRIKGYLNCKSLNRTTRRCFIIKVLFTVEAIKLGFMIRKKN